jgi:hypothetical protein
MSELSLENRIELEAAAFRRLVEHLRSRSDVQNIDLMIIAGFCRNCLAEWQHEAAVERGLDLSKDAARESVYGMRYADWKKRHHKEPTADQLAAFEATRKGHR